MGRPRSGTPRREGGRPALAVKLCGNASPVGHLQGQNPTLSVQGWHWRDVICGTESVCVQKPMRREDYYRCQRRYMRDYVDAAVSVAEAIAEAPSGSLRNPEIARAAGLSDDPEGYGDFRLAAIRAGLLAEVADSGGTERYRVPIPSFAAFLREEPAEPIPTLNG